MILKFKKKQKRKKKNSKKTKKDVAKQQSQESNFSHPYSGPNFDSMYLETTNPLQNPNNPTQMPTSNSVNNYNQPGGDMMEPMAANDFGGIGGAKFILLNSLKIIYINYLIWMKTKF